MNRYKLAKKIKLEKGAQNNEEKINEYKVKLRSLVLEDPARLEERINVAVGEILNIKKQFNIT